MYELELRFFTTKVALVIGGAIAIVSAVGCSAANSAQSDDGREAAQAAASAGAPRTPNKLAPPKAGTVDNALAKAAVLEKWQLVRDSFTGPNKLKNFENGAGSKVKDDEAQKCVEEACPDYFSDIVCHYYCWHPSYEVVTPNVRGCFTEIVRAFAQGVPMVVSAEGKAMPPMYPAIYDYCLYQNFDYAKGSIPTYDPEMIAKNKKLGDMGKVGVLKWVDDNERDVFKHVMWTWYNASAFKDEDQQEVINKFYGVTDPTNSAECSSKRWKRLRTDPQDGTHCLAGRPRNFNNELVTPIDIRYPFRTAHPNGPAIEQYMSDPKNL